MSYKAILEDLASVGRDIKRQKDVLLGIAIMLTLILGLIYLRAIELTPLVDISPKLNILLN